MLNLCSESLDKTVISKGYGKVTAIQSMIIKLPGAMVNNVIKIYFVNLQESVASISVSIVDLVSLIQSQMIPSAFVLRRSRDNSVN